MLKVLVTEVVVDLFGDCLVGGHLLVVLISFISINNNFAIILFL